MAEKLRIEVEFVGVVNGVPVTITGRGHVGQGRLDAELVADVVPLGFDPAVLVLGGLDVIVAVAVGDEEFTDPIFARTDLTLLDDAHREMGHISTSLRIETGPGWCELRGQFLDARTNLEPMERATGVERVCVGTPVPLGLDGVVLTSTAAFETSFGHEYLSVAVSRIAGMGYDLNVPPGIQVGRVTVECAAGRERICRALVGIEYTTNRRKHNCRCRLHPPTIPCSQTTRAPGRA